jgi:hypothetical protein
VAVDDNDRHDYKRGDQFSDNFARPLKSVGLCVKILHWISPASKDSRRPSIHIDLDQKALPAAGQAADFTVWTACGFVPL